MTVAEEQATEQGSEKPKTTGSIIFNMPLDLKEIIEREAKEKKLPVGAWVRRLVADHYEYILPATAVGRARKYATAEERVAAQKQKQAERNELIKKLLAEYRAKASAETTETTVG